MSQLTLHGPLRECPSIRLSVLSASSPLAAVNLNASSLAVVIEPRPGVADAVADCLRLMGYDVLVAATHFGAVASIIERERVEVLVATVPTQDDDRSRTYLARARACNPGIAIVIMLSDPDEPTGDAPQTSIRLVKPFGLEELIHAIQQARTAAWIGDVDP